jgi:hypothetical protein
MYTAGCRLDCCRPAKTRTQKELRLRMMNGPLKKPILGVQRRINSLRAGGWPLSKIAAELGVLTIQAVYGLLDPERTHVTVAMHRRMNDVFEHLGAVPGPSEKVKERALGDGHHPPLAWYGLDIDNPDHEPRPESKPRGFDLDEWWFLVKAGEDHQRAAERCGVTLAAVERAAERASRPELAAAAAHSRRRWS